MIAILLFVAVCFLAYSNGANDNFKGVASLYGSRTCSYRTALNWATITTFAGSITAAFLAATLIRKFSGKGLVPDMLTRSPEFLFAVACGAGATVILAAFLGFPISTTHGITGALTGAGYMAVGSQVNFGALGKGFVLPLLLSPLLAVATGALVYLIFRFGRLRLSLFGVNAGKLLDKLHFLSAGALSFARGLNDAPKIAALLLVLGAFNVRASIVSVAVAMAIGGLLNAGKVAHTMSHKITDMNPGQGFAANLSTALLVTTASYYGLPVSTTHITVGSLLGIGISTNQAKWKPVSGVLLSWVITLPCAALLAAITYHVVTAL